MASTIDFSTLPEASPATAPTGWTQPTWTVDSSTISGYWRSASALDAIWHEDVSAGV